jgi:hypothetical protein
MNADINWKPDWCNTGDLLPGEYAWGDFFWVWDGEDDSGILLSVYYRGKFYAPNKPQDKEHELGIVYWTPVESPAPQPKNESAYHRARYRALQYMAHIAEVERDEYVLAEARKLEAA